MMMQCLAELFVMMFRLRTGDKLCSVGGYPFLNFSNCIIAISHRLCHQYFREVTCHVGVRKLMGQLLPQPSKCAYIQITRAEWRDLLSSSITNSRLMYYNNNDNNILLDDVTASSQQSSIQNIKH